MKSSGGTPRYCKAFHRLLVPVDVGREAEASTYVCNNVNVEGKMSAIGDGLAFHVPLTWVQ